MELMSNADFVIRLAVFVPAGQLSWQGKKWRVFAVLEILFVKPGRYHFRAFHARRRLDHPTRMGAAGFLSSSRRCDTTGTFVSRARGYMMVYRCSKWLAWLRLGLVWLFQPSLSPRQETCCDYTNDNGHPCSFGFDRPLGFRRKSHQPLFVRLLSKANRYASNGLFKRRGFGVV